MLKQLSAIVPAAASAIQASPQKSELAAPRVRYDASNLPALVDRLTDVDIPNAAWSSWIPKTGPRALRRALIDGERRALQARVAELQPALLGFDREQDGDRVALAISDMFGGFRSMREQGEDVVGRIDSAMRVMNGYPAWAIEQGCLAIQRAGYEVTDRDGRRIMERHWPPSDPEICQIVERIVRMRRDALVSAEALLAAPVELPDPARPPLLTVPENTTSATTRWQPPPTVSKILSKEACAAIEEECATRRARKQQSGDAV